MTVNGVNTCHMYVLILPSNKQETESLPIQDFIIDPLNPNVDDLLENISQSYEAVIDEYGMQSFVQVIGYWLIPPTE